MKTGKLRAEITADPLARGYASMNAAECLASLTAENRSILAPVGSRQLLEWVTTNARRRRIADAVKNPLLPQSVRAICETALDLVQRPDTQLDLNQAGHAGMVDALVNAQILTSEERAGLVALASVSISRAEELGVMSPTVQMVAAARAAIPWTAEVLSVKGEHGNVRAKVRFTNAADGETVDREFFGDTLDREDLVTRCRAYIGVLEDRDAARATISTGVLDLT